MSAKTMQIVTVAAGDAEKIEQMAALLIPAFRVVAPDAWKTDEETLQEVQDVLRDGFCRAALDDAGKVLGWAGGLYRYGFVWELHPLAVDPARQGEGVGRALMLDMEGQVRERGCLTLILGTDDEADLTTLSGIDLYADIPGALAAAKGTSPHPFEFYRKLGYTLIGVVPDANGRGKPDIVMGKRI